MRKQIYCFKNALTNIIELQQNWNTFKDYVTENITLKKTLKETIIKKIACYDIGTEVSNYWSFNEILENCDKLKRLD